MQHTEGWLRGKRDARLYRQSWLPAGSPVAALLIVHGLAEHSGRYSNLIRHFAPKGYAVYSFDLRGHGRSEGMRGYVDRFSDYVEDLKTFCGVVTEEVRGIPVFLLGHSMGGLVAAEFAIDAHAGINGVVLSAPLVMVGSSMSRLSVVMAEALSLVAPKLGVSPLDASAISKDDNVVGAYISDPLVYHGRIRARLGAELINAMNGLWARAGAIKLPALIMHGSSDRLVNPAGSPQLYKSIGSTDKTLKVYQGLYHEIFNEPERSLVLEDTEAWLSRRVGTGMIVASSLVGSSDAQC